MTNSTKKELQHYDIKQQFNNLLFNSFDIIKHYDDLLINIQNSVKDIAVNELINNHYDNIKITKRHFKGINNTFKRFYKIYTVEKHSINNKE